MWGFDKAPKPGEFKYQRQRTIVDDRLFLVFTVLFNGSQDSTNEAIAMLASMSPCEKN